MSGGLTRINVKHNPNYQRAGMQSYASLLKKCTWLLSSLVSLYCSYLPPLLLQSQ